MREHLCTFPKYCSTEGEDSMPLAQLSRQLQLLHGHMLAMVHKFNITKNVAKWGGGLSLKANAN